MKSFNHALRRFVFWPLLFTGHLLAVSLVAWHLLAQFNFAYPLGYQALEIDQHIAHYGPLNRYKPDFAQTTPTEHKQLFAEITAAVQDHGIGLADISYRLPDGSYTALMREAEVIHLQDVANLIGVFYWVGIVGAVIWSLLFIIAYRKKLTFPSLKKILSGLGLSCLAIAILVMLIGPKAIFYWLHVQIFPDEHQWFFFYQDSLMTTLMKAPDLFGFITVILVLVIVVFWATTVWAMDRALSQVASPKHKKIKQKK